MKQSLHFFAILTCIITINAMDESGKSIQYLKNQDKEKLIQLITRSGEKQAACLQELRSLQQESQLNLHSLKIVHEQLNTYRQNLEHKNENFQRKLECMEECMLDHQTHILRLEEMFIEQEERDITKNALPHEQ